MQKNNKSKEEEELNEEEGTNVEEGEIHSMTVVDGMVAEHASKVMFRPQRHPVVVTNPSLREQASSSNFSLPSKLACKKRHPSVYATQLKKEIELMTTRFVSHCQQYGYQLSKVAPTEHEQALSPISPMLTDSAMQGDRESEKEEKKGEEDAGTY